MYPDGMAQNQSGAGLPVAIFIITVLSLIVLGMSQLQQASGDAISLQIQSQRAFHAAESGAQIAVYEALEASSCSAVPASVDFSVSALSSCSAAFTCESFTATIGGGGNTVYSISSTGECGAGADAATRVLEVRVR